VKRLALAALVVLAGCGGKDDTAARAFGMPWPHGTPTSSKRVATPGAVRGVFLGSVRLSDEAWICVSPKGGADGTRARYGVAGSIVTLTLDNRAPCSPARAVGYLGGYAREGGFVGDWAPGAVVFSP
jgi:hypothetical protein